MRLAADRPLLREAEKPIATLPAEATDMLDDTGLLIIGLFDQARIILHASSQSAVFVFSDGWPCTQTSQADSRNCCSK